MLTLFTQKAITILRDIAGYECSICYEHEITPQEMATILSSLERKGLINRLPEQAADAVKSYKLARPLYQISLLELLEALNEHLNCNQPATEELYRGYGRMAWKLGIVNHMTRLYLEEIKLTEC